MCDAKLFRNTKINAARFSPGCIYVVAKQLLLLTVVFVRNCQFCTSLCATSCQYAAAILCSHSLTETVLVLSLSVRGLECSFHRLIFLYVLVKKYFALFSVQNYFFFLEWQRFCKVILLLNKKESNTLLSFFVIPKRFERLTHALEGRCSIQLSYGTDLCCKRFPVYRCKDSAFLW